MSISNPSAFDAFAAAYDADFTHSLLGQLLRPRVWEKLAQHFTPGQYILELTCGTGEDALWLARRGVHVTATDGSAEMVRQAEAKAAGMTRGDGETKRRGRDDARRRGDEEARRQGGEEAERWGSVEVKQVSLQEIGSGLRSQREASHSPVSGHVFDGVFSNFGGLNTIGEWRSLAEALAGLVKPGGKVILVPMGPFCPWEIAWYLAHGQFREAFRRFSRAGAPAKIGGSVIPIWYPPAGRLRTEFRPWFRHIETQSLELWLPPSYLDHFVNRWPAFFTRLNQFEKATARLSGGWGDHYIVIFERN